MTVFDTSKTQREREYVHTGIGVAAWKNKKKLTNAPRIYVRGADAFQRPANEFAANGTRDVNFVAGERDARVP